MEFLAKLAKNNPALARTLEISILWALLNWAVAVIDLLQSAITWQTIVDWKALVVLFLTTTWAGILAWLSKFLRDEREKLETPTENETTTI